MSTSRRQPESRLNPKHPAPPSAVVTTESSPWTQCQPPVRIAAPCDAPDLEITGDRTITFRGFGACFTELGWRALGRLPVADRAALLDEFFHPHGAMGFEFCRVPVGANDYSFDWYSHNENAGDLAMEMFSIERDERALVPYLLEALRRNPAIEIFASPWSPPTWLKCPPVYNYGKLRNDPASQDAYALYFVKFVQAFAARGIRIAQLHVQNEPCSTQKFPSCVMTGAEMRDFIARHLGPAVKRAGLDCQIWLGTINGPETDANRKLWSGFNDYAFTVLEDPAARRFVRGISYQWAGKYALWRTRLAYPDLPLIQSENECGDGRNSWEEAWYVADLFHHYLAQDAEAYVYWNPVLEPGGESSWGWKQDSLVTVDPATGALTRNPQWHIMRHYAGFIRKGHRRLVCRRPWAANSVAFASADSTVVVIRNPLDTERSIRIAGASSCWEVRLPARSLTTICLPS